MATKKQVVRLIRMMRNWRSFCQTASDQLHLEFSDAIDLPFECLIIDMMGFPEDNSLRLAPEHDDFFCRDYLLNILFTVPDDVGDNQLYDLLADKLKELQFKE